MKEKEVSRMELENELGTLFRYQCNACLATKEYHVNESSASKTRSMVFVVIMACILLFALLNVLLFYSGFISLLFLSLPFAIYFIVEQGEENKVNTYNMHRVNREVPYIPKNKKI